jgi:8-oxo-dGTP pyrophosphatase MutT (NUDIX family)
LEEKETVNVILALNNGERKGMIAAQQRAETKVDSRTGEERLQSNPYVLQFTFGGKVEKEESLKHVAKRECKEELGEDFAKQFDFEQLKQLNKTEFVFKGQRFTNYNYFGTLTNQQYDTIVLHSAAEKMIWIRRLDLLKISTLDKSNPFQNPQRETVMFADLVQTLQLLYGSSKYAKFLV